MILYLYKKKVVWIVGRDLGWQMDESVDFNGFLRYLVRYWDFGSGWGGKWGFYWVWWDFGCGFDF